MSENGSKPPAILWHSNAPWSNVGYGIQTALFTPRIRDLGYQVAISAFWGLGGSQMWWEGMPVLPGDDNWGNRLVAAYAAFHGRGDAKGCLTLTLMDVWVLQNQYLRELNLASWVPVDHDPVPPRVAEFFKITGSRPIAMSKFGQVKLQEAGFEPLYVPHGLDTKIMTPRDDAADVKEALKIPTDAYVVGMVANNQGFSPARKAFPEVMEAFARFRTRRNDAILYLHCEKTGIRQGLNLEALAEVFDIADAVRFPPQVEMELGMDQDAMASIFSMIDVLANPSYGEGFGIPIVEAQACGTPVIVTDWTSMPELCGAGWKVGGERWYDAGHGAFFMRPSPKQIAAAMNHAYDAGDSMKAKAVAFAANYDADLITQDYWKPILEDLTREGRTVAELPSDYVPA